MSSLLILLLSHYIGDYALQTEYLAANKGKDNYILVSHVSVWTFVVSATALLLNMKITFILIVFLLFVPHFIMDYIKARNILWCKNLSPRISLSIDQAFHMVQIILLWIVLNKF
ncbi:DUF3307 domain-containing protein [Lactococcus formosensis subsp. bovis]|uniref:DUF3307 domain-containing protein n=1 Tax=Lactococcus formosensis TaxID=1281486 RepID=UPI001BD18172|nr:DUF3307 domain-containing protein [Lactococcus formosensis]